MGRGLRERKDLRRKCRFTKGKAPWTMIILAMALTMSGLSACNPAAGRAVGTDVQGTDHPESGPEGDGMKGMDGSNEEPSESYDTEGFYDPSGESEKPEEGSENRKRNLQNRKRGIQNRKGSLHNRKRNLRHRASSMKMNCGILKNI